MTFKYEESTDRVVLHDRMGYELASCDAALDTEVQAEFWHTVFRVMT